MNNETKECIVMLAILHLLSVAGLIILAVMLANLKARCRQLEDKQNENMKVIHNRVTTVANNLQNDINNVMDSAEKNYSLITEAKNIIKNTNHALARVNKRIDVVDTDVQEIKETTKSKSTSTKKKSDVKVAEVIDTSTMQFAGTYTLTAYEWTDDTCANGNYPTTGYTVACNSIPLGTRVYVEGYGYYTVEDRVGKEGKILDIYMGDVETCRQFGTATANVYIVN